MAKLTEQQSEILTSNGWTWAISEKSSFATNKALKTELHGDKVFNFLEEEAEDLLTPPYSGVRNISEILKAQGYAITNSQPLEIKGADNKITTGICAEWLLRELVDSLSITP